MKEIFSLLLILTRDIQSIMAFLKENQKTGLKSLKDEWTDSQEVMEVLRVSPRTLQKMRNDRSLPYTKFRGRLLYRVADLKKILEKNYNFKPPKI